MARQAQVPGGAYVNEVATAQRQVPGMQFVNETVAAAAVVTGPGGLHHIGCGIGDTGEGARVPQTLHRISEGITCELEMAA